MRLVVSTVFVVCLLVPAQAVAQKAVLIMRGTNPPRPTDQAVVDRLEQEFDMETVLIDHTESGARKNEILDAEEPDVIIILESTSSGNVTNQLNDREEPIIVQEWFLLDDMGFVEGTSGCDNCWGDMGNNFGNQSNEMDIDIVNDDHPIITSAGLDGEDTIAIYEFPGRFQWGNQLIDEAEILAVATNGFDEDGDGVSDDVVAFVIEPGAELLDGSELAGLRIGCWIHTTGDSFINQTPQSLDFWDAMLTYALGSTEPPAPEFLRGDCNDDGAVNITDGVCILNWLFGGEATPGCVAATNTNGDDVANITDATYLLNHLFAGGPAPAQPFPDCGPGMLPADVALGCANPPNCQ